MGSPALVLAGAGSGKTGVITRRMAWLVNSCEVRPENIYAVTFTNKAAREMKHRLDGMLGKVKGGAGVNVSTFHRLGLRILRKEAANLGLKDGFSIVDSNDASAIVGDLLQREFNIKADQADAVRNAISTLKNTNADPGQTADRRLGKIFDAYQRYLRACNAVDLDDMIALPVQLLAGDTDVRNRWRSRIHYLLVDEYQDTNSAQYQMVRLLGGEGEGLMVVGDDDQSIYAWRGAMPENLQHLGEDYPDLRVIKLEQNYRSRGRILKLANHLIKHNPRPFEKVLWSELGYGDPVRVLHCTNEVREAERVVSELMSERFQKRLDFSQFAIIYRSNYQSRVLEQKLMEMQIPYQISGGQSFFDRTEIRDMMAYLRLLANPADDAAFARVINTPRRGIGAASLETINSFAARQKVPLSEVIHDQVLRQRLSSRAATRLGEFASLITTLSDEAGRLKPSELITLLTDQVDYRQWLMDQSDSEEAAERRWQNVLELSGWMDRMGQDNGQALELVEIIRRLTLSDMLDRNEDEEEFGDQVSLMTLHAAKGLEFDHVFIVGVEEDILPHANSQDDAGVQEERRLFYVGITRARHSLCLSMAGHRKRYGEVISCSPSRFLDELPPEDLDWSMPGKTDTREEKKLGSAHLAGIREMLQKKA